MEHHTHPYPSIDNLTSRGRQLYDRLRGWIWQQTDDNAPAWERVLRFALRISAIIIAEYRRDRLTLRASSLTFTIVLSLVPTLALGTAVLKGLGAGDQMRQAAYRFIDQVEESGQFFSFADPAGGHQSTPLSTPESQPTTLDSSLTGHLRTAVGTIFDYVEKTDFATLGAFGIVGLVLAVLSVLGSIERSMNAIWQAESNRPFGRKIIDYLALMVLLPISINLALATEATFQSKTLHGRLDTFLPSPALQHFFISLLPVLLVIGTFTILYRFLPNTRVQTRSALLGGIIGGIFWFLVQAGYVRLQIGVAKYNAIYGSFATLPLFLFWIYMGWLVFLGGAETAFAFQNYQRYRPMDEKKTPIYQLNLAFDLLGCILEDFSHRRVSERSRLAQQLHRPEGDVQEILSLLEEDGKVRRVCREDEEGWVPAGPVAEFRAGEIVELLWGQRGAEDNPLAAEALEAAKAAVFNKPIDIPPPHRIGNNDQPVQSTLFNS